MAVGLSCNLFFHLICIFAVFILFIFYLLDDLGCIFVFMICLSVLLSWLLMIFLCKKLAILCIYLIGSMKRGKLCVGYGFFLVGDISLLVKFKP